MTQNRAGSHTLIPLIILFVALAIPVSSSQAEQTAAHPPTEISQYRFGVLAIHGKSNAIKSWTPTAKYIESHIKNVKIDIIPLTLSEMRTAVRDHQVDHIITNSFY